MRIHIYIDGFNLYYGCLRRTADRWLDIEAFADALAPDDEVTKVRYFTARIKRDSRDPGKETRQHIYLRALETLPLVTLHYGTFQSKRVKMRLASPEVDGLRDVYVLKSEEKGSDVNLASHLLMDGFKGAYDAAIVVSGDADLNEPIRMVVGELQKPVHVFNPHRNQRGLRTVATSYHGVPELLPARCHLPNPVIDRDGRAIHCPAEWLLPD